MSFIESLRVVGTAGFEQSDCLPCRIFPVYAKSSTELFISFWQGEKVEFQPLSLTEFSETGSYFSANASVPARENHCLLQTGTDPNTWEYIPEEKLPERLAEIGIEAVKNAKSFLDEGKDDEAEKLLWYAARAMPKSVSVLMLLKVVLKGKVSEEEMNVLDRHIKELMVV